MIKNLKGLRLVSLFSGIGGLDLGFIKSGCRLVWANDSDKNAVKEYRKNISRKIVCGDINKLYPSIPYGDVLIGGFPCQAFSLMGLQKGFQDNRGALFFTIVRILKLYHKKPSILVLENVKNLLMHDHGKTFHRMKRDLEELGYYVNAHVMNTCDFGLPQVRRRVLVVCFLRSKFNNGIKFKYPKPMHLKVSVQDLLDKDVDKKYFLSKKILPTILSGGSGDYRSRWSIDTKIAKPLTSTMFKMHRANQDNYYTDKADRRKFKDTPQRRISDIRRLTPNECRKLQGFPDDWKYIVSDTQLYRQFGNAVSVNVSCQIAQAIGRFIKENHNAQIHKELI